MRKVFLALSTFQNISIFYQYRRAKSTIKLLSVTTWIIFMTTSQFLRVLQYSSQIVETGAICLEFSPNFLHSHFTPLFSLKCAALLPQCWAERISVFWSPEMTANPNQHWRGKNHTSVSRFVTRIVFVSVGRGRVTKRMKGNHFRLQQC